MKNGSKTTAKPGTQSHQELTPPETEELVIQCAEIAAKAEAMRINRKIIDRVDWEELLGPAWEGCKQGAESYDPTRKQSKKNWLIAKGRFFILDYLRSLNPAGNRRNSSPLTKHSIDGLVDKLIENGTAHHDPVTDHRETGRTAAIDLADYINFLPKRIGQIVRLRAQGKTMKQVGAEIGLSESRISQLLSESKERICRDLKEIEKN